MESIPLERGGKEIAPVFTIMFSVAVSVKARLIK
jgi:hypothetical protein